MSNNDSVALLLNKHGKACSVYASREDADAKAKQLNADPFVAAEQEDSDAPYSVEVWSVRAEEERGAA